MAKGAVVSSTLSTAGRRSCTRSPVASRRDLGAGAPSSVTRPRSIRLWASPRDRPAAAASQASSRLPAPSSPTSNDSGAVTRPPASRGSRRLRAQFGEDQQPHPNHDGAVGQVEGGPEMEMDEVDHPALQPTGGAGHAVDQVAEASPRDQPERQRGLPGAHTPDDHAADNEEGGQEEQQRRLREDPEGAAGVAGELEVPEAANGEAGPAV